MHSANAIPNSRLVSAALVLLFLAIVTPQTQAQRPTSSARDNVRAIQQKDMDQLLQLKLLAASREENVVRQMALKEIGADFKELQLLNNKMMSEAWSKQVLDYAFISDMVSHIKAKASRLRLNLNLPQPKTAEKPQGNSAITNADEFRAALLVLDRTIMSFVSNPLFQKPNTIEVRQGADARRDLETIIDLTEDLKKTTARLSKAHP